MSGDEFGVRLDTLEFRLMHQESAIEELTRSLLSQQQTLKQQAETIERLEAQLRALTPSPVAPPDQEPPPPHY